MVQSLQVFVIPFFMIFCISVVSATIYNVENYGARPDGRTDSTRALLAAWTTACHSSLPSTVYVPKGSFLVGRVTFSGPCNSKKITFQIDGVILQSSSYGSFGNSNLWIAFYNVDGVSLYGGVVDGQGAALWSCKSRGGGCPPGTRSLTFTNSKNVMVSGLTSINSEFYHIAFNGCQGVQVQGVRITAPGNSPNTDGIHIQKSMDITITTTGIKTGDDCISVGPGTKNLWIEQVTCGPGHGISIGSLGKEYQEDGVMNVTVKSTVFTGTDNGLRIKTWARPSNGFVRGVRFENSIMNSVQNPIIIDQNYCPYRQGCPNHNSGVKITDVSYSDIRGSSATPVAVSFDCSPSNPCTGLDLFDIKLTYGNRPAQSFCKYAAGRTSGIVVPPIKCL